MYEHVRDDEKLWRYMDFSRFVSLLETHSLFFSRADRFGDTWEGAISPIDVDAWEAFVGGSKESAADRTTLIANYRRTFAALRRHTYISCWHQNSGESEAMWKLYLKSTEGIALQTSFGCLKSQLERSRRLIRLGKVQYRDYRIDPVPGGKPHAIGESYLTGPYAPFISKRRGFAHENEVRAVFQDSYRNLNDPSESDFGIAVCVEIGELIENIYMAPQTPAWLHSAVQTVLDKFDVRLRVAASEFDEPPPC